MAGKIYALLVGIDRYPEFPLGGCVRDADAMRAFLEGRVAAENLELRRLMDTRATREAMLREFRDHLGRARQGDTALFFFAGHGSREPAPPEYADLEPDGYCETLIAFDSRPAGRDLADKELAILIAEVAQRGPHVVVILDCCHSGTATRGIVRQEPARGAERPAESYWFFGDGALAEKLGAGADWHILPRGPHVLLAACQDDQTARELAWKDGTRRGLFSYHLTEALQDLGAEISYRELFKEVQIRVSNRIAGQLPYAEGELERTVLEGAYRLRPKTYHVRARSGGQWWLDAGAVHGVQLGSELTLLPPGSGDLKDLSAKLATVRVTRVTPAESHVVIVDGALPSEGVSFPALTTRLPLPPLEMVLCGDISELATLRDLIADSPLLAETSANEDASLIVGLEPGVCRLRRPEAGDLFTLALTAKDDRHAQTVAVLEHVARWHTIATLKNPGSPLAGALEMTLCAWIGPPPEPDGEPRVAPLEEAGETRLPYRRDGGSFVPEPSVPGRLTLRLKNRSERPLHFALLALDETFAVQLVREASGTLAAGNSVWVRKHDGIRASVPDRLYARGVTQRTDTLMVIASDERADFELLTQPPLGVAAPLRRAGRHACSGLLDALIWRFRRQGGATQREIDDEPEPAVHHQWAIWRRAVVAERPTPWREIEDSADSMLVGYGLRFHSPAGLTGKVRLHNHASARRRCPALRIPPAPEDQRLRSVALTRAIGSDPGLSVLELRLHASAAPPTQAWIRLETAIDLEPGEVLVAAVCATAKVCLSTEPSGNLPTHCHIALPDRHTIFWIRLLACSTE